MSITRHESGPILSLAVENGNTVYLAGIVPKNMKNDIKGQTAEVLAEIDRLLAKCGTSKSKLLQANIWVTDIRNRALMNEVWNAWTAGRVHWSRPWGLAVLGHFLDGAPA